MNQKDRAVSAPKNHYRYIGILEMLFRIHILQCSLVFALMTLLAGCSTIPEDPQVEEVQIREAWSEKLSAGNENGQGWLEDFHSPTLEKLVERALANNQDLVETARRLKEVRQRAIIAGADRLPEVSAEAGLRREKRNFVGFEPLAGGGGATGGGGSAGGGAQSADDSDVVSSISTTYAPGLRLNWELDLWGRLADAEKAAFKDAEVAAAALEGARLSLSAQVTRAWVRLNAAARRVELARESVQIQEQVEEVVQERYQRGIASAQQYYRVQGNLEEARAVLESRIEQKERQQRGLEVLVGRYPDGQVQATAQDLPASLPSIPVGVPSDLLKRRPDLAEARARYEAAHARASEAAKLRLPTISLTGSYGTSSEELNQVLDGDYTVWSLAANLAQPIFQGGRLKAQADAARMNWLGTWAAYRASMLQAFEEVETALNAEKSLNKQGASRKQALQHARKNEKRAYEAYRGGLDTILPVLEQQRDRLQAQLNYLNTLEQYLTNRVDLYLALGGAPLGSEKKSAQQWSMLNHSN